MDQAERERCEQAANGYAERAQRAVEHAMLDAAIDVGKEAISTWVYALVKIAYLHGYDHGKREHESLPVVEVPTVSERSPPRSTP